MTKGRFILTLSLSVAFHIAAAGAQQSGGKAAIEGVVLGAGTGAPLAGARVTLIPEAPVDQPFFQGPEELNVAPAFEGFAMPPSSSPTPPVVTDPQGRFAFTNVDAGSYRLYAEANGYVAQAYGPRQNMGTTLRLTAGQILSNIAFQMIPAGNVSGRIHDRDHHPLPGVPVQLLRATYTPMGQQVLEPAGVARTNDRGEYRLFWITPGRYYLKAGSPLGPDSFLVAMGGGGGQAETINPNEVPAEVATAFFPGAPNLAGASAIEVRAGGELTGIDWGLPSLPPTYRVRTRVMDSSTGQPPPAVQALIAPTPSRSADSPTEVSFDIAAAMSATQNYDPSSGVMEFPNIPPGVYTVSVMTVPFGPGLEFEGGRETALPDAGPVSPGFIPGVTNEAIEIPEPPPPVFPTAPEFIPQVSTGSTTVTVTDRNVEDAGITVTPAGSIAGHLQIEGEMSAARWMTVQLVPLQLNPVETILGGGPQFSRDGEDVFHLRNVAPGEYRLTAQHLYGTAYIKEARLDGLDILNEPLAWRGGAGTLEVVVSSRSGQVQGVLTGAQAETVAGAQVVLIPDNRRRVDLYKIAVTDERGHFTITGVAPGAYKVFSWDNVEPYGWFNPDLLGRSEARGSAVLVTESNVSTVEAQLIPGGNAP